MSLGYAFGASRRLVTIRIALVPVLGLLPVGAATVLREAVNAASDGDRSRLVVYSAFLAAALVLQTMLTVAVTYVTREYLRRCERYFELRGFERLESIKGLRVLEDPQFQDDLHLALDGAPSALAGQVALTAALGQHLVTVAGFGVTLVRLSPPIALVVAASAGVELLLHRKLGRLRGAVFAAVAGVGRRRLFARSLQTDSRAALEMRLFGAGPFLRRKVLQELAGAHHAQRAADVRTARLELLLASSFSVVVLISLLSLAARADTAAPGDIALLVTAMLALREGSAATGRSLGGLSENAVTLQAVGRFDDRTEILALDGNLSPPPLRTGIEFNDVWFRYDEAGPWALRSASFELPAGAVSALVGPNGAGKSTIVKLLCRMYDPDRGAILWDGVDIRRFDIDAYRQRLSAVFQRPVAYDLLVRENVSISNLGACSDDEAVWRALTSAGAGFVRQLPGDLDQRLRTSYMGMADDQPSTELSGGQWQRIALARMLFREADVYLLDEPAESLDLQGELELYAAASSALAGRTALLVTHRMGSIELADRVVIIDEGRVADVGTLAELMSRESYVGQLREQYRWLAED